MAMQLLPGGATRSCTIHLWRGEISRARFELERTIARRVDHPRILRCFDAGEHDGAPYYAIDRAPGMSLEQVIRRRGRPFRLSSVVEVGLAAAEALAYFHEFRVGDQLFHLPYRTLSAG